MHAACWEEILDDLTAAVEEASEATLRVLADELCRFSLRGTHSASVLRALLPPPIAREGTQTHAQGKYAPQDNGSFVDKVLQCEALNKIWKHEYVLGVEAVDCRQLSFTRHGESSLRPGNPYMGLTEPVQLAKTSLPASRGKERLRWPSAADQCPGLFDEKLRAQCAAAMTPTGVLHSKRSQQRREACMLPDYFRVLGKGDDWTAEDLSTGTSTIADTSLGYAAGSTMAHDSYPVLLLRHSCGASRPCSGSHSPQLALELCGWDLVVPSVWASAVWIALNYCGACSVGLDEMEAVQTLSGTPSYPRDFPDSSAGREYWEELGREVEARQARRPRRKKNVRGEGSLPDWTVLFRYRYECSDDTEDRAVIRNTEYLAPFVPSELRSSSTLKRQSRIICNDGDAVPPPSPSTSPALPFRTLVRVLLTCNGRGTPQCGAEICRPTLDDYRQWMQYMRQRATPTTSKGRRVGEWWGQPLNCDEKGGEGDACNASRAVVGYVSTAFKAELSRNPVIAVGFCEAVGLKNMLDGALQVATGAVALLVLYRNSRSRWLRPAIMEIHTC